VVIQTVPVGNPGNAGEWSGQDQGQSRICGAVGYVYEIAKFEVTAGQYTEFLNAVATADTYGLYNVRMADPTSAFGCNIQRSNSSGSYTYSVGDGSPTDVANWGNRPVNYVSWGDVVRFCNWLHNGQPMGAQDVNTTENGSYDLSATHGYYGPGGEILDENSLNIALLAVTRNANATWAIPTEDEWYKAAYHKNDGVTGNYWDYPTGSNAVPNNGYPQGDTGNSATFYDGDYTVGSPYYRTNVGFFGLSDSPYGTFDQGGNLWEWNEAALYECRGIRGSAWNRYGVDCMHASYRYYGVTSLNEYADIGFRLSTIPEPTALGLVMFGIVLALGRRRLRLSDRASGRLA